jgi:hypothetical protein
MGKMIESSLSGVEDDIGKYINMALGYYTILEKAKVPGRRVVINQTPPPPSRPSRPPPPPPPTSNDDIDLSEPDPP